MLWFQFPAICHCNARSRSACIRKPLYLAHDKQPPAPPLLLHLILARSKHTNLSIRSTTLRRILSWIPPPLSVDPVHLRRSLWEISTTCLVHQQGTSLFFCINHRIEFDAVASSLFLVEHCFQRPFVFCRYRNFVGLLRAKFAHQKEQGHFFSPAWTEDPGLSPPPVSVKCAFEDILFSMYRSLHLFVERDHKCA